MMQETMNMIAELYSQKMKEYFTFYNQTRELIDSGCIETREISLRHDQLSNKLANAHGVHDVFEHLTHNSYAARLNVLPEVIDGYYTRYSLHASYPGNVTVTDCIVLTPKEV